MRRAIVARAAAAAIIAALLALCVFGRVLQRTLPVLVELIPYFGAAVILCILLATIRLTGCRSLLGRRRATTIGVSLLVLLGGGGLLIEQMIVHPIERIHFIKYCALSVALFYSQEKRSITARLTLAGIFACLFGVIEETLQYFVPDRIFDARDMLLNICGSLLGVFFAWITTLWQEQHSFDAGLQPSGAAERFS